MAATTKKPVTKMTAKKSVSKGKLTKKQLAALAAAEQTQQAGKSRSKPRFRAPSIGSLGVEVAAGGGAESVQDVGSLEGANLQNYSNMSPIVGKHQEGVVERSMTDAVVERSLKRTSAVADDVASRWQERMARDSKTMFKCPISGCKHEPFATKRLANAHIREFHPRTIEMFKLQKADPASYTPKEIVVNPKRTIEDLVPENLAKHMRLAAETHAGLQHIQNRGRQLAKTGVAQNASSLLMMPESSAEARLPGLSDDQLIEANRLFFARGKTNLVRETRRIGRERGVKLQY